MLLDSITSILPDLNKAFFETTYMVAISLSISLLAGLPLGIILFVTDRGLLFENLYIKHAAGLLVNLIRSVPFIILLVALLPLTQLITGTTIGPKAASVSLSVAAIPFFARLIEASLREVDKGVIEAAIAVGASPWMIIREVMLPEAKPGIVQAITITAISLIGYSAMAGIVGGGGIGDFAIRFGYYRYDNTIMITTVLLLIIIVQLLQLLGDQLARKVNKR
ncbi:methionine ABC transporter permease [Bacillus sp. NEB1478]|uniref:methionine ABC transporter permease n=1 Tax=Bacillus sp. NEB1478 TaxID=3073816 RepID=UPI002873C934|nr:methionine ABC transporter permease [Bacillus sp. NEB1478]WNB92068.1 methionine ABC transporter permease [Bacillus sp. NEB1478]